jgi:hypothetical protein
MASMSLLVSGRGRMAAIAHQKDMESQSHRRAEPSRPAKPPAKRVAFTASTAMAARRLAISRSAGAGDAFRTRKFPIGKFSAPQLAIPAQFSRTGYFHRQRSKTSGFDAATLEGFADLARDRAERCALTLRK